MLTVNSLKLSLSLLRVAICAVLLLGISEVDRSISLYLNVDLYWCQLFVFSFGISFV